MFKDGLEEIVAGKDLSEETMSQMISEILSGDITRSQIGAFMGALSTKGETFEELMGAAKAMRRKATRVQATSPVVLDTCGTGGDGTNTFNISTTTAFVVAAVAANRMAPWYRGANRNPILISRIPSSTISGSSIRLTPRLSSRSALPH